MALDRSGRARAVSASGRNAVSPEVRQRGRNQPQICSIKVTRSRAAGEFMLKTQRHPAESAHPRTERSLPDLNGASVLITGGTGSFGRAFVRTVLERWHPRRFIVFSRDEQKQFDMAGESHIEVRTAEMRFFIGDVRDANRLEMAMRNVDYVIHAAALKHVPIAEYNPFECIRTNVNGAENIVTAAIRCGVKRVVALSTDKAVNPVNLYGASKLAADKIFIAAAALSPDGPRFSVVRYGNVVGSRGSVIPFFQKLIDQGAKSLPITDPRMTRFWITLEQGVDFVLTSLAMMIGQEIFVPKIPTMAITELAQAMAPGMPTHVVGIRPGEKIHEVLVPSEEARNTLDLGDRFVICPATDGRVRQHYLDKGARAVGEGFHYESDSDKDMLDGARLRAML